MTADRIQIIDVRLATAVLILLLFHRRLGSGVFRRRSTLVVIIGVNERTQIQVFGYRKLNQRLELRPGSIFLYRTNVRVRVLTTTVKLYNFGRP